MDAGRVVLDGYRPGAIAGIVALHADYYSRNWGFGAPFECKVAGELAGFVARMDAERDLLLCAWAEDAPVGSIAVGSIAVDVSGGGALGAHLRWFIVADRARGTGLGRALMQRAMAHCRAAGATRAWLTTFAGLDAARALYERHGFTLASESPLDQWKGGVREQLFRCAIAPGADGRPA